MPLSIRQKCLGGVMVLAGVAFFWDHAQSAKPAAENLTAPELLHSDAAPVHSASLASNGASDRVATRLSQSAKESAIDPLHSTDAFTLPSAWPINRASTGGSATAAVPSASELEIDHGLAEEFVRKHHVDAVMTKNNKGYAIVDGRALEVGQSLDQFMLVSVSASSAVFQRHRIQVQMRLNPNSDVHLDGSTIDNQPVSKNDE